MKQHTESLVSYVMEWGGLDREQAVDWLDKWIPKVDMESENEQSN